MALMRRVGPEAETVWGAQGAAPGCFPAGDDDPQPLSPSASKPNAATSLRFQM
jgi:hypothetical protein